MTLKQKAWAVIFVSAWAMFLVFSWELWLGFSWKGGAFALFWAMIVWVSVFNIPE